MLFPAILLGSLFIMSASALVGALVMSRQARLDMAQRMRLIATPEEVGRKAELAQQARSKKFTQIVYGVFAIGVNRTWGMNRTAYALAAWAAATGALVFFLTYIALGTALLVALPLSLLLAFIVPRMLLLRQQREAEREFTDLFPDSIIAIARMLRAGLPVSTAVRSVSQEAFPPVSLVFASIANQIEIGTPIEDALDASSQQIGLADFRFFAVAVVLQHATGGNLATTLEILADIVRRRRAMRLKARSTTAEIRVSAYVLGSMPFLIIGLLLLGQPGYLTPLFTDPRGHIILGIALAGFVLAGLTMRQMMRSVTSV